MKALTPAVNLSAAAAEAAAIAARRRDAILPTCLGCGAALATRTSYVPRPDGMYDVVVGIDQDAMRRHLLEHHRPVPRQLTVAP